MGMTTHPYPSSYYELGGWENTKPGWRELVIPIRNESHWTSIVKWMHENLDKCERHCRWIMTYDDTTSAFTFKIKFRYERDFMWCRLRWS